MLTPQQAFDQKYISSSEIIKRLQINRTAMLQGWRRGLLPPPIVVNDGMLHLWERETAEPLVAIWANKLEAKRTANA